MSWQVGETKLDQTETSLVLTLCFPNSKSATQGIRLRGLSRVLFYVKDSIRLHFGWKQEIKGVLGLYVSDLEQDTFQYHSCNVVNDLNEINRLYSEKDLKSNNLKFEFFIK